MVSVTLVTSASSGTSGTSGTSRYLSGSLCDTAHTYSSPVRAARDPGHPREREDAMRPCLTEHRHAAYLFLCRPRSPRYAGASHWEGELHISLRLCKPRHGHLLSRPATGYGPWVTPGRPVSRRLPPSHGCVDHQPPWVLVSVCGHGSCRSVQRRERERERACSSAVRHTALATLAPWLGRQGGRPKANRKVRTGREGGGGGLS